MKSKRKIKTYTSLFFAVMLFSGVFPLVLTDSSPAEVREVSAAASALAEPDFAPLPECVYEIERVDYTGEKTLPAYIDMSVLKLSSDFALPLESGRVSSGFGFRVNPVTGVYRFHSGLDIAAPKGSPIRSMLPGVVRRAEYDSGYGKYLMVEHDSGLQTLYAHCSELLCDEGEYVSKGEVIALVGSTGNSTGPHLHVELRLGGKRYDPVYALGEYYS